MASPKFYDKTGDLQSPPFINVANIPNFRDPLEIVFEVLAGDF
jgi:hypothetical protein